MFEVFMLYRLYGFFVASKEDLLGDRAAPFSISIARFIVKMRQKTFFDSCVQELADETGYQPYEKSLAYC